MEINMEIKTQYSSIKKRYGNINAINHMIRTPATCILGFNYLLSETNLNAKQKEYLQGIQESAQKLLLFLDNLSMEGKQ
jgi:signal transduction histidine kinase